VLDERETQSCAVCGRTILRGERVVSYVAPEGDEIQVCALCKPRAEASGWLPPGFVGEITQSPVRRRQRGGLALRERLVRRGQAHAHRDPEPPPPPPDPLEVFNSSREARKVAGLRRSLGEPRVCVRERRGGTRLITVAWDLSWYQWSVDGETVEQVAKGDEISELPIDAREWNAEAGEDGTLRLV
jgi:predicted RNA-binding Zn-ribbon protein involved in translation (DUF1610 family)